MGSAASEAPRSDSKKAEARAQDAPSLSDDYAATGIGSRTDHAVEWVSLDSRNLPPPRSASGTSSTTSS